MAKGVQNDPSTLLPNEQGLAIPTSNNRLRLTTDHSVRQFPRGHAQLCSMVPRPRTSANAKHGLFTKDDFAYDAAGDRYQCPAGEILTYRFSTVEQGRGMRYYSTPACGRCALKSRCTRSHQSRRITRWVNEPVLEAMEQRLKAQPELY